MFTRSRALRWTGKKLIYCARTCSQAPPPPSMSTSCSPNVIHMLPCIVLNAERRTKNRGGLGTRLVCMWILMFVSNRSCKRVSMGRVPYKSAKDGVGTLSSVATAFNYMYKKERPCVFTHTQQDKHCSIVPGPCPACCHLQYMYTGCVW